MPIGPGKYDDLCTFVREKANAAAAVVVIVGGNKGAGFSVQCYSPMAVLALAELLEAAAKQMRRDLN